MFGNLFEKMEEQRTNMLKELESMRFEHSDPEGKITVVVSGNRRIVDIRIGEGMEDHEQLEDLLIVLINEAMSLAAEAESELAKESVKGMMPPGFDGLSNLFNR